MPTPQHEEAALAIVRREAEASGVRFEIDNRLVAEAGVRRAA